MTLPSLSDIPAALRERHQWVVWRYEARDTDGKPTKVPYQAAHPMRKASSSAPRTWATVETALSTAGRLAFDGIGYVFSADDPFAGFDLDDMLDDNGAVADWARPWLRELPTYTEISPSGHGVKGIVIGKLPGGGINADIVELYDQGRYFTITGRRFNGAPAEPVEVNGALDRLYAFAQERKAQQEDQREQRRRAAYAQAALRDEADRVRSAPEGTRNDQLNRSAFALAQFLDSGLLTEETIADALADAAGTVGLGAAEIRGTLRSGIRAGKLEPRTIPAAPTARTVIDVTTGELITVPPTTIKVAVPVRGPAQAIDFHDLLAMPRRPIRWFAPGFLREGLGILAGEANIGKTPLAIQLALALASGSMWMNKVQCPQCKVLFIGTEYTHNEMAYVAEHSAAGRKPPRGMLSFKSLNPDDPDQDRDIQPETPAEALALIDYFFRVERYEVLMIDVFTGFLPDEPFKQNVYRGDYKEFKPYHLIALRYQAAILGMWHTVKRESNPRYMYNGSSGLWGVPASRMTMYTDADQRIRMFSMPRFEKKTDWALAQEQTLGGMRWVVSDAMPEPAMSDMERTIYRWLKDNADRANPRGPATIAEMLGLPVPSVKTTLRRMLDKNLVDQSKAGAGYFVDVTSVTPVTDVTSVTSVTEHFDSDGNKVTKNGEKGNIALGDTDAQNDQGNKGNTVTPVTRGNTPIDALPADIRMTTRMMLASDVERNIDLARSRCEAYGIDFDAARDWARREL